MKILSFNENPLFIRVSGKMTTENKMSTLGFEKGLFLDTFFKGWTKGWTKEWTFLSREI
jgi:hypothetical protein